MNESIAQLAGLKNEAFLNRDPAEYRAKAIRASKLLVAAPALVCALGVLIALAVILSPLIPLIELWRRSLHR
jgi:hypothetical protein